MRVFLPYARLAGVGFLIPLLTGCQETSDKMDAYALKQLATMKQSVSTQFTDSNVLLKEAIAKNDAEGVKQAAARGADINACTGDDMATIPKCTPPLAVALGAGKTKAALALIEAGMDVNSQNFRRETMLGIAVHFNNVKVMKALLERGADTNRSHGITYGSPSIDRLLNRAAKAKQAQAVEYLLQYGAQADWKDRYGRTAYWYAGGKLTPQEEAKLNPDMRRMRQALLAKGVNPDPKDYRGRSYAQVLKLKINHESEAIRAEYLAFTDQSGERENVAGRLYRVDPIDKMKKAPRARNEARQTRLREAIENKDIAAVKKALKEDKPELNVLLGTAGYGRFFEAGTPLSLAIDKQQTEIAILLLEAGADPMMKGEMFSPPLHEAADKGNALLVRALLKHGADPNYGLYYTGKTPLMFAAMAGSAECVKLLLDKGANPDARERNNYNEGRNVDYYLTSEQHEIHKLLKATREKRKAKKVGTVS